MSIKILLEIARSDGEYETEYDGRMYSYCFFCNAEHGDHKDDCLIIRAQKELGEIWLQEVADEKERLRKEQAEKDRYNEHLRKLRTVVICEYCVKKTREIAIARHQAESKKCHAKRSKV